MTKILLQEISFTLLAWVCSGLLPQCFSGLHLHGGLSVEYVFAIRVTAECGQAFDTAHLKDIHFASNSLSSPLFFNKERLFFLMAPHTLSAERLKSLEVTHSVQYSGQSESKEILRAVNGSSEAQAMPPARGAPLSAAQHNNLERHWVQETLRGPWTKAYCIIWVSVRCENEESVLNGPLAVHLGCSSYNPWIIIEWLLVQTPQGPIHKSLPLAQNT